MKTRFFVLALLCALQSTTLITAKIHTPKSADRFQFLISMAPFAVAHFVDYDRTNKDSDLDIMQNILSRLSKEAEYTKAGVIFIGVNRKTVPELFDDFSITGNSTILLFKKGDVVTKDDKQAELNGFITDKSSIQNFIEEYLGSAIDKHLEKRPRKQRRVVREYPVRRSYAPVYDYGYYDDYYYPYDYGYYGYGPGFSFGVGDGLGFGVDIGF